MFAFPVIAVAIALIAIGRGGDKMFLDERGRDRTARRAMLVAGIVILVISIATFFI